MLLVNTYVAASRIEGVGVFAAAPIPAGARIWRLDPEFDRLIPIETYETSPPHLKALLDRYAYPSPDRPGFLVYEVDNGRFMNHSETPNTDFSPDDSGIALRDIAEGEELTCDYRQFYAGFDLGQPVPRTPESPSPAAALRAARPATILAGDEFQ
jgi:SET domain-containing protein